MSLERLFEQPSALRTRLPLTILIWLGLSACVFAIARSGSSQWDFRVYYAAIQGLAHGINPYLPVHPYTDTSAALTFVYPPLTLYCFEWLLLLSPNSAALFWLGLKLVAVLLLVRLWNDHFERLDVSWPVALFIALGFNAALFRDFSSGNIGTFEQLGIWFGFTLLLRERPYAAAIVLACVAQFKLLPAAFIGLIPLIRAQDGWKPFSVGCSVFLGLLALNPLLVPGLTHEYLNVLSDTPFDDRGSENPTALALLRDVMHLTVNIPWLADNRLTGTFLYVLLLGLLVVPAAAVWSRRKALSGNPRLLLYFGCALFAVAMPRMKDYSYTLMLMPTLFVLRDLGRRGTIPDYLMLAVGLMICAGSPQTYVPRLGSVVYVLQSYLPLFIAAAVLTYILRVILNVTGMAARGPDGAPEPAVTASEALAAPRGSARA